MSSWTRWTTRRWRRGWWNCRAIDRLEADWLRRLAEFDRREAWRATGRCRRRPGCGPPAGAGAARERVTAAQRLDRLPVTRTAFAAGEVGYGHVRLLSAAGGEERREAFARSEEMLVDAARQLDPGRLRVVVAHWRHAVDPDGALVALARRALDAGDLPDHGGERPHVTVRVDLATLRRRPVAPAGELEPTGPVCAETVRRLACDAGVSRVVTAGESQPLDVGRRTRVVPPALRRALVWRDRGCRFPGCDRPAPWTDAHHLVHSADGGPTSLDNLVLLCRRHHRVVHERGHRLEDVPARPP